MCWVQAQLYNAKHLYRVGKTTIIYVHVYVYTYTYVPGCIICAPHISKSPWRSEEEVNPLEPEL